MLEKHSAAAVAAASENYWAAAVAAVAVWVNYSVAAKAVADLVAAVALLALVALVAQAVEAAESEISSAKYRELLIASKVLPAAEKPQVPVVLNKQGRPKDNKARTLPNS